MSIPIKISNKSTRFSRGQYVEPSEYTEAAPMNEEFKGDDNENENDFGVTHTDDDFLPELNNDVFVSQVDIEQEKKKRELAEKESEKIERKNERDRKKHERLMKEQEKAEKAAYKEQNDLFKSAKKNNDDDEDNVLYGKDRLKIIARINQYKTLFEDNKKIQAFKIKENHSIEHLQAILNECEALIEIGNVETFITDIIFTALKPVEMYSTRTPYNITGLSEDLKANPKFHQLAKQLYIKYNTFSNVPPEAQMMALVFVSAYACVEANKRNNHYNNVLHNTRVNPNDLFKPEI